jgi:hypothetical protein
MLCGMEKDLLPPASASRSVRSIIRGSLISSGLLFGSQIFWVIALVLMAAWLVGALFIMLIWILVGLLASVL